MGLISSESRALWESKQSRRTTQSLSLKDSALLLQRDQLAKNILASKSKPPLKRVEKAKENAKPEVEQRIVPQMPVSSKPKVEEKSLLGKRPRESSYSGDWLKMKLQDANDFRKRRRLLEDQLRLEEIQKQKEVDESKKKQQQNEAIKKQKYLDQLRKKVRQDEINKDRAAARKSLEKVEREAKAKVEDRYKVMKDFMELIGGPPIKFPTSLV